MKPPELDNCEAALREFSALLEARGLSGACVIVGASEGLRGIAGAPGGLTLNRWNALRGGLLHLRDDMVRGSDDEVSPRRLRINAGDD